MSAEQTIARLVLEDGTVFAGRSFGSPGEKSGEVVFNTAMAGYQEILTDPSYRGQIVTMTYPLIGNYGVNDADVESAHPWVEGFVVKEASRIVSNRRASGSLQEYLRRSGIVAIENIDTRALTRKLRIDGAMNGVLSTTDQDEKSLLRKAKAIPKMTGLDLVRDVTSDRSRHWKDFVTAWNEEEPARTDVSGFKVACLDYGVKHNIVRLLVDAGCDVTVFPATAKSDEIAAFAPDGVFLSNGPGDPAAVGYAIECIRGLLRKEIPIFGICLGHQLIALALGAKVYKLKFGHHGANHPVKNLSTERVEVTSQNHGFAVDDTTVEGVGAEVTHVNLNDGTVEGIRHRSRPVFSVQYHPEAAPGPHDARYLFAQFTDMMKPRK